MTTVAIRLAAGADLPRLHVLNAAAAPGVGPVTREELAHLVAIGGPTLVAETGGKVTGFILCMTEGLDYPSPNYLWLAARYEDSALVALRPFSADEATLASFDYVVASVHTPVAAL